MHAQLTYQPFCNHTLNVQVVNITDRIPSMQNETCAQYNAKLYHISHLYQGFIEVYHNNLVHKMHWYHCIVQCNAPTLVYFTCKKLRTFLGSHPQELRTYERSIGLVLYLKTIILIITSPESWGGLFIGNINDVSGSLWK